MYVYGKKCIFIGFGTIHGFRHILGRGSWKIPPTPWKRRDYYIFCLTITAVTYYWYSCLHSIFPLQFILHPIAEMVFLRYKLFPCLKSSTAFKTKFKLQSTQGASWSGSDQPSYSLIFHQIMLSLQHINTASISSTIFLYLKYSYVRPYLICRIIPKYSLPSSPIC